MKLQVHEQCCLSCYQILFSMKLPHVHLLCCDFLFLCCELKYLILIFRALNHVSIKEKNLSLKLDNPFVHCALYTLIHTKCKY